MVWFILGGIISLIIFVFLTILTIKEFKKSYEIYVENLMMVIAYWAVGILCIVIFAIPFIQNLQIRREIREFEETRLMVSQVEQENTVENYAINNQVIEVNKWLTKAKSNRDFYGTWFSLYPSEVLEMEYIKIEREDN